MLSIVKEIGIFIVIAQAILYFVPGDTYVKYVKVLIGIMMITKMISPVFLLLSEEGVEEVVLQGDEFLEKFEDAEEETLESGVYDEIYIAIGKEIENKLNQNPAEGYTVEQVNVIQKGDEYEIHLSVAGSIGEGRLSEKELEVYYAEILRTGNVKVQITGK